MILIAFLCSFLEISTDNKCPLRNCIGLCFVPSKKINEKIFFVCFEVKNFSKTVDDARQLLKHVDPTLGVSLPG